MAVLQYPRSSFGVRQHEFPVPNLNLLQTESYQQFWKEDLTKILAEFSPIEDTIGGRWKVILGPDFFLEQDPNNDEYTALLKGTSFAGLLYINVTVENLVTKEKKTQRVFVGKVPLMTKKGNFIVNANQKIVVGQLVKSPGVLFSRELEKGGYTYTARIIPARGIWIDFILGADNVIYTRIDRKKKFPATQLLKLFGITKEQEIKDIFKDFDNDPRFSIIETTLEKDQAFGIEDAVNSIYKKIRPGDIVSIEQGKKYLISLFEDLTKYDFGDVGRYKFNSRLNFKAKSTEGYDYKKNIGSAEIIATLQELVRMAVARESSDSIDSLSNRRIRAVGEWLQNTFKAGLSRVVRNSKDKMTTNEDANFTPAQLVNMRPLAAMIEDFFSTSQLSRLLDQTNILSEMDDRQFLTCTGPGGVTRERAGFDIRDVHPSHYGRLCPINTPEGPAFGLNVHLAIYSRINKMGFMETPYLIVKDTLKVTDPSLLSRIALADVEVKGKRVLKTGQLLTSDVIQELIEIDKNIEVKVRKHVSKEVAWLDSQMDLSVVISEHINQIDEMGNILVDIVAARKLGDPVQINVSEVQYMDVASNQILSLSSCMIPFVSQTDGYRLLMGTNMQGQSLPLIRPERPLVGTGFETVAARDSGYLTVAECDGEVIQADGSGVTVQDSKTKEKYTYKALKYLPSNNHTSINQRVVVKPGQKVSKGDYLIEGFGIHEGEFAIGQNVRVAYMPFKGYNFEDAIVLSERLIQRDKFSSTHIHELTCDLHETRLGTEEFTRDIPNVPIDKLRKLDKEGIVHLGAFVQSGDILVGKISPKGEVDLSPEDKLIRVLFGEYSKEVKDSSLYLEHGLQGKVVSIRVFSREDGYQLPSDVLKRVHIWLATTRKIKPGDKMAGRHGNKGVVSIVLPVEDMPYTADGQPVDMVLNPLGVVARMNLGQLLEAHLGLVCHEKGIHAVTQPLNEIPLDTIKNELVEAGFREDGKMDLWDGQTGIKYERPVVVGYVYFNKLYHLVDDKVHTRSTGSYSLITQQPLGGRANAGGQRFGEMEVWALEAYGAAYALQEMLTIKSDDSLGREAAFEAIIRGKPILSPNLPGSFIVLANELTALGVKVNAAVTEAEEVYGDRARLDEKLALSVDEGGL